MRTKEVLILAAIVWLAFRQRPPIGSTDVRLSITEPGFEDEEIDWWPPR